MWKTPLDSQPVQSPVNTLGNCFREAQELLGAAQNRLTPLAKTLDIFQQLQPVFAGSEGDARLALLALAIWRAKGEVRKKVTESREEVGIITNQKTSDIIRAGAKIYFFDIKYTQENKPYLVITESRYKGENEERERTSIAVFPEYVEEFLEVLSDMSKNLA